MPAKPTPASAADFMPLEQLRSLQLQRLQHVVRRAYDHLLVMRRRLNDAGVDPRQLDSLDALASLPLTTKNDLRDAYPFDWLASPRADLVRVHASSGTTGQAIVVAYTQRDLDTWTSVMVRTLQAYGVGSDDVIQNSYGYGLFTGGLGVHYGAERLGAMVVPTSGGNTDRQITVLKDFGVTVICSTPSYFLHLLDRAGQMGVDFRALPLRAGVFGAEPWTEAMRGRIENAAGIKAYDIYGISEIVGPGVAAECQEQNGLHVFEDHFFPEIIDPQTALPLPAGEEGELVLTTLSKEAMPLIRYRTGDISAVIPGACPCGRVIRRIQRIARRTDDMLIVRGVSLYPSQIEAALLAVAGALPQYQIVRSRKEGLEQLELQVEADVDSTSRGADAQRLRQDIAGQLKLALGIRIDVSLVPRNTIPRSEGKAKRVIDQRD